PAHALEERLELMPGLGPHLPSGEPEHAPVLLAQDRNVGVVVELDQLRTPKEADLRLGGERHADGAAQRLGAGGDGAERGRAPVEAPDALAHLPSTRQPGWHLAGPSSLCTHMNAATR